MQTSKRVITEQRDWSTAESFDSHDEITGGILGSADAKEGARVRRVAGAGVDGHLIGA